MGEKQQLAASCTPAAGDLAHNTGVCHDWELNLWHPFGFQDDAQSLSHTSQGRTLLLIRKK